MKVLFGVVILVFAHSLNAQVFELSGGSSTLYQASGGRIVVHGGSYEGSVGLGTIDGRIVGGAQVVKTTERAKFIVGSENIPFNLPTDIFDSDHYLTAIGCAVKTKLGVTNVFAFAGATSTNFNNPFFDGAVAEQPAGILLASERVAPRWIASTMVLLSQSVTVINSLAWDSGTGVKMAFSSGAGSSEFYGAASLAVSRPRVDLKAAYISAGSQFRRADVATPLTSEPNRENILLTVRPTKNISLSVARQNYLSPVYQSTNNLQSTVNQVAGNLDLAGFGFSAMAFQSTYNGNSDIALALSASRSITQRIRAQATYLESRPKGSQTSDTLVTNVQEEVTPRWSLTQTIDTSNGQSTVGFGGSFLSNVATLSADYESYYVPARVSAPFQQALILNAQVHLSGGVTMNGATFVAPDGRLLYTTEAEGGVGREQDGSESIERRALGNMLLRGRVINSLGQPIMGAAIRVDELPVYTDSNGYFYVRERRSRTHPMIVMVDEFLDGAKYRMISAPPMVRSSPDDNQMDTIIVVEQVEERAR